MKDNQKVISIVIPVYNEEKILAHLYERLTQIADTRSEQFEFIFVNDGSKDGSLEKLIELNEQDKRVCVIDLARNYGQQNALTAGIDEAKGDAVVLMDVDMEDRPEDIHKFLEKWAKGYQVVYAIRKSRKVTLSKLLFFKLFHSINAKISQFNIKSTGIFGLMDRVVVDHMKYLKEHNRYIPGLRSWMGFSQIGVEVERGTRYDLKPRMNMYKLYRQAFDSFTSFPNVLFSIPLYLGIILFLLSILSIVAIIILKIYYDFGPWGWASLICIILLVGSLQFSFLGLLGEYISRIFIEVRNRPLYIVKKKYK